MPHTLEKVNLMSIICNKSKKGHEILFQGSFVSLFDEELCRNKTMYAKVCPCFVFFSFFFQYINCSVVLVGFNSCGARV